MRIEDCIVHVERRTGGGCLDLAVLFIQRFPRPVLRLLLAFAVPSCVLTWWLSDGRTDLLPLTLFIFSIFASLMSATLIATAGPRIFGVPFSIRSGLRSVAGRLPSFLLLTVVIRVFQLILSLMLVFPALVPTAFVGHLNEVLFLEKTKVRELRRRFRQLTQAGGYSRNLSRLAGLLSFWMICSLGLFVLIDQLAAWLFSIQILQGTMISGDEWFSAFAAAVLDDRSVLLLAQIALWIPLPLIRLAWFFCYLDQRIRNECWDLDLQFRAEASRLEEQIA